MVVNFTAKLDWLVGAEKGRGGLAATDKGKKELKTVLSLVRREVESCCQYGLWQLKIMTKNGGIIGGTVSIEDTGFFFTVEKKKNKKAMAITVERPVSSESVKELWKGGQMLKNLAKASQTFSLTFPLRCRLNCSGASCKPRLKEPRSGYFEVIGVDQLQTICSGYLPSLGSWTVPASAGLNSNKLMDTVFSVTCYEPDNF